MTTQRAAVLLPLLDHEVPVVLDALNLMASREEESGDCLSYAPTCDWIARRVRALSRLQELNARELLKMLGLGSYKNRPQG